MYDFSHAWLYAKVMHDFSYAWLFALRIALARRYNGLARRYRQGWALPWCIQCFQYHEHIELVGERTCICEEI